MNRVRRKSNGSTSFDSGSPSEIKKISEISVSPQPDRGKIRIPTNGDDSKASLQRTDSFQSEEENCDSSNSKQKWFPGKFIGLKPRHADEQPEASHSTATFIASLPASYSASSRIKMQQNDLRTLDFLENDLLVGGSGASRFPPSSSEGAGAGGGAPSRHPEEEPDLGRVKVSVHKLKYSIMSQASLGVEVCGLSSQLEVLAATSSEEVHLNFSGTFLLAAFPADVCISISGKTTSGQSVVGVVVLPIINYLTLLGTPSAPKQQWVGQRLLLCWSCLSLFIDTGANIPSMREQKG
jgi:hypothetical protein